MVDAVAWATVVIAFFTVALFILQFLQHRHDKKVSSANYKLALFEERLKTYVALGEMFGTVFRDGKPNLEAVQRLRAKTMNTQFMFPDAVKSYLDDTVKKTFDYDQAEAALEELKLQEDLGEDLAADHAEKKRQAQQKKQEILKWFVAQYEKGHLNRVFREHLKLPETI